MSRENVIPYVDRDVVVKFMRVGFPSEKHL